MYVCTSFVDMRDIRPIFFPPILTYTCALAKESLHELDIGAFAVDPGTHATTQELFTSRNKPDTYHGGTSSGESDKDDVSCVNVL